MFDDLDNALSALVRDTATLAPLGNADVSFETPDKTFKSTVTDASVNLFLYEVKENRELRDLAPITQRTNKLFIERRPPLRVECSYLVTAWAKSGGNEVQTEHLLLAQAFGRFSKFPTIPEKYLSGSLVDQPFPPPTLVAQMDAAKNTGEYWNALGIAPRPYFNLLVTIAMDLNQAVEGSLVTTASTRYLDGSDPTNEEERLLIGGIVVDRNRRPVADAWVRLEPSGETYVTTGDGRFIFAKAKRGAGYSLRARATGLGDVTRLGVEIPSLSGEYNLQFP